MKSKILLCLLISLSSLTFTTFAQTPGILWQRCVGNANDQDGGGVTATTDGGFITVNNGSSIAYPDCASNVSVTKFTATGILEWETCFPDQYSQNITSIVQLADSGYAFVTISANDDPTLIRLDKAGNILSKKKFGGSGSDYINFIQLTKDGNLVGAGLTNSIDGDLTGINPSASTKGWLIKFNLNGQIIWQKCIGDDVSRFYSFNSVRETKDGSFVISGVGKFSTVYGLMNDAVVVKTDKNGNVLWERHYGGSQPDAGKMILEISDGSYILSGILQSADAGIYPYHGSQDAMLVKISKDGDLLWAKAMGGSSYDYFNCLIENSNKEIVLAGGTYSKDGDIPANNTTPYTGHYWIACVDEFDGEIKWQRVYGGADPDSWGSEDAMSVSQLKNGTYLISGVTSSNDGDVYGNNGGRDIWLVNMGPYNTVTGTLFIDRNSNGQQDTGEGYMNLGTVNAEKPGAFTRTVLPLQSGVYKMGIDTGSFNLYLKQYTPYYNSVPSSKTINHNTYFNTDTVNFALQPIPGKRDLQITVIPLTPSRVGMPGTYRVLYKNVGTDTVPSVKLTFIKDARQTLVSASPSPSSTNQDTAVWNRTGLKPMDTASVTLVLRLGTPPAINLNDTIQVSAIIDPVAGDLTPADDTIRLKQVAISSFDPNDKTEFNSGSITAKQVSQGDWLMYLIRFQNTGTDTAFNISITDTLDSKLDWNTIQVVEASHSSMLDIKGGNILTWNFNNIKLVDSTHNEPLSHGYILYRIRPKTTLGVGDVIRNSAFIYFDFNKPVKTNEQLTVVRTVPVAPVAKPVVTGMQSTYCSNLGTQKAKLSNNPASEVNTHISVTLDATTLSVAADSTFSFMVASLAVGTHRLSVTYSNSSSADSVVYSFIVAAAVTPDVNVTSNISTVSNLNDPVVITAVNAAGGGSNPLYTFARDRAITNILQAENVANTVTIQPNTLSVGNNWIYVRMKSSTTCYTVQANTDSIKIERPMVTGITDMDFPNQVIKIYPNPFSRIIYVTGLNTGKGYTIIINNLKGQQVYSRQIKNVNSYTINKQDLPGGQYWLSIYDNSKKRLIGTMPLIKE